MRFYDDVPANIADTLKGCDKSSGAHAPLGQRPNGWGVVEYRRGCFRLEPVTPIAIALDAEPPESRQLQLWEGKP